MPSMIAPLLGIPVDSTDENRGLVFADHEAAPGAAILIRGAVNCAHV